MKTRLRQSGIALVVTLIMLVVLTLIVVSAIRFGNLNLKIAGNVQTKSEAQAATQVAIERILEQVKTAPNIGAIPPSNANTPPINVGGASYKVAWAKPACTVTKPVSNADLSPNRPSDIPCYESADADKMIKADGSSTTSPSACNDQHWDIAASVDDSLPGTNGTGTQVTTHQGFAIRVSSGGECP